MHTNGDWKILQHLVSIGVAWIHDVTMVHRLLNVQRSSQVRVRPSNFREPVPCIVRVPAIIVNKDKAINFLTSEYSIQPGTPRRRN